MYMKIQPHKVKGPIVYPWGGGWEGVVLEGGGVVKFKILDSRGYFLVTVF